MTRQDNIMQLFPRSAQKLTSCLIATDMHTQLPIMPNAQLDAAEENLTGPTFGSCSMWLSMQ